MKYLTNSGLSYFFNKIKAYLTSSTYLNSIGISNSEIDDIADDAGYSSGSLPASEDIFLTGDIIPNTDNSVDLGASSKNIKMIYTKGITIDGKTVDTDANGNLVYDGHIVDTIEEQGTGYIRYTNGIQICWGNATNNNNIGTGESIYALPKAFNNSTYSLILTAESNAVYYVSVWAAGIDGTVYKTNTQFGVFFCDRTMNLMSGPLNCTYIAIGTWK